LDWRRDKCGGLGRPAVLDGVSHGGKLSRSRAGTAVRLDLLDGRRSDRPDVARLGMRSQAPVRRVKNADYGVTVRIFRDCSG
jgi:hypothetical protein